VIQEACRGLSGVSSYAVAATRPLHRHLGDHLASGDGANVTLEVGSK
jgi:hypothetical protein